MPKEQSTISQKCLTVKTLFLSTSTSYLDHVYLNSFRELAASVCLRTPG